MVSKNTFSHTAQPYRLSIVGRNVQVTDAMKQYASDKLAKIEKFHNHILDIQVVLDIHRKTEHTAMIVVRFDHFKVKVQASTGDMYASLDKAVDRLQAKILRWKGKIQDHHRKSLSAVDMQVNVLQRPEEEEEVETPLPEFSAKIIGQDTRPLKLLTTEEAMMKMELSEDAFLVFRDEIDRHLKVIYRRSDGHYGLIQPV